MSFVGIGPASHEEICTQIRTLFQCKISDQREEDCSTWDYMQITLSVGKYNNGTTLRSQKERSRLFWVSRNLHTKSVFPRNRTSAYDIGCTEVSAILCTSMSSIDYNQCNVRLQYTVHVIKKFPYRIVFVIKFYRITIVNS